MRQLANQHHVPIKEIPTGTTHHKQVHGNFGPTLEELMKQIKQKVSNAFPSQQIQKVIRIGRMQSGLYVLN